jgi:hypothetical protein
MKRLFVSIIIGSTLLAASVASARDIHFTQGLLQGQFKELSKEAGAALAYRNAAPAAPLGITGFDIGVQVSVIDIKKDSRYWQAALNNDPSSYLYLPSIRARKGLPFGIDVGAMYSYVPDSNVKLYGFEVSKALLEGSALLPALGVRGSYTKLAGVSDLDIQTVGIDANVSKGFAIITPYAGAGLVWVDSKATGNLAALSPAVNGNPLSEEKLWLPRGFVGAKISILPFLKVTGEIEYAVRPIYTLKTAIDF